MYTKALCRQDLSPAASALRHNLSLNFDKRENGSGMERWKGELTGRGVPTVGLHVTRLSGNKWCFACKHVQIIQSLQNHEPETTASETESDRAPCARSPAPTHNLCVAASGVRVQPECRCASRGRPRLRFGRLGTRCWAARSPPMHEQKRWDESRGTGNQHNLIMGDKWRYFTGSLSFQRKYCLKYPIIQSCFIMWCPN